MNRQVLWTRCENPERLESEGDLNTAPMLSGRVTVFLHSRKSMQTSLYGTFQDFHSTYYCCCIYIPN